MNDIANRLCGTASRGLHRRPSGHGVVEPSRPACGAACVEPLENRTLLAAAAPVPPGTIYFADSTMVDFNNNQYPSFAAVQSMKGDGSGKAVVSSEFPGDPSRLLHGGRWLLGTQSVPGTYPNGLGRREIFATPLGGGAKVQLTDNPDVQPSYQAFWSADDSFISFSAVTWTGVTSGGNYTHPGTGGQWLADAKVFRVDLSWGTEPTESTPTAVLDAGEKFNDWGGGVEVYPDVVELDWSPAGTQLAYQKTVSTDTLHVASFDAALTLLGTVNLGAGHTPEFSPNGSRIAYSAPSPDSPHLSALWTVGPNGSGVVRLTKTAQMSDYNPGWSPDGKQITFTRRSLPKGYQPGLADVMRVPAAGGSPINLTKDLEYDEVIAWRSDVQAPTTPSASAAPTTATPVATSTSLFSVQRVSASGDAEGEPLIEILA
jgi:hypothetical protein